MKENKNFNPRERQAYVPSRVKVIEVTVQRAILTASNQDPTKFGGNEPWNPSH